MRRPLDLLLVRAAVAVGGLVAVIVVVCEVLAGRYGDDAAQVPWTVGRVLAFFGGGLLLAGLLLRLRRRRRMRAG